VFARLSDRARGTRLRQTIGNNLDGAGDTTDCPNSSTFLKPQSATLRLATRLLLLPEEAQAPYNPQKREKRQDGYEPLKEATRMQTLVFPVNSADFSRIQEKMRDLLTWWYLAVDSANHHMEE
jgi:hypothetical protein